MALSLKQVEADMEKRFAKLVEQADHHVETEMLARYVGEEIHIKLDFPRRVVKAVRDRWCEEGWYAIAGSKELCIKEASGQRFRKD
jgi:ribosomal protein S3AE